MMKNRIAEQWYSYAGAALPGIPADSVQRIETRRAFYAGAQALQSIIMKGLTPGPNSEKADEIMLAEIEVELLEFLQAVKRGLA